jgi:hypothetical protein
VKAAALLVAAALTGCGGSQVGGDGGSDASAIPPALKAQLDRAAATWAAAKGNCPVYSYDRRFYSVFGGGTATEVEVRNDVPTRRRQSMTSTTVVDGGYVWMVAWDEVPPLVGSHGPQYGFPASTVEQLHAECATILAHDPAQYALALEVEAHGVPTTCTYRPNSGCADDCTTGITIVSFDCAPLAD